MQLDEEATAVQDRWWRGASPIPTTGTPVVVAVDGVDVAIVELGGELVAFDDTCTHRSCPLSEGVFDAISVTCPCHKSRFDLTSGQPLNGPATDPIRIRQVSLDGNQLLIAR